MLKPLNKWIRRAVLLPLTAVALVANAQAQTVTIGVQSMFAPWKDAIAQKSSRRPPAGTSNGATSTAAAT